MIALARVDDRLVHGQVTAGWVPHVRATLVVVASDRVADDALLSGIVKSAASEVPIEVLGVAEAARRGAGGAWEREAVLVLFESLQDACRALDAGLPLTRLNIGGLRHDDGRLCLCDGVTLDGEDCTLLRGLCVRGVSVDVRLMPTDRSRVLPHELESRGA
ncbi:MAG TPA: PTS sugar transporter subunit IIB [Candidatus Methanoperedens sp.]|nr:PTS sugar transporter subunit IIB [Candidatus Methanoperedens sp.]